MFIKLIERIMRFRRLKYSACVFRPPYDYIQLLVEMHLGAYLAKRVEDVQNIIIVGGCEASEVDRMLVNYPRSRFLIFEPSRRYSMLSKERFLGNPRVTCIDKAVADFCGTAEFFETTVPGSGSLMQPAFAAERDYGLRSAETFSVEVTTLDSVMGSMDASWLEIDLIWCDVQGAELKVLKGAAEALSRCGAVFLEVALWEPMYVGAALYEQLRGLLATKGFCDCGLGIDPLNGTGNALFMNPQKRGNARQKL